MNKINIKRLSKNAKIPTYGSEYSAGCDIYACIEGELKIESGETALVPTGLAMEIPKGYAGLIYARSGLATKRGLAPANKVGVIDSDYRGEILVSIYNQSKTVQIIEENERIAQLVITPIIQVDFNEVMELSNTKRGEGGFGSTGSK